MKVNRIRRLMCECGIILCILGYEIFYFRKALDGQALFGVSGDSFLINMILEHWYNVFCGRDNILTLASFWPARGSLGYSDALLAPGLIYSILRIFIAEPFSAINPTLILLHLIGVLVFYGLLRKLGMGIPIALTGVFLSFWSCSFTQLSYHAQFFSMALIPLLFLCVFIWWKRKEDGIRVRLLIAFATTVVFGLLWLSSYYTAYYFSMHIGISFVIYGILVSWGRWKLKMRDGIKWLARNLKEVLACVVMQILWIVPFLGIYLPAYSDKKPYDHDFILAHAPDLWDLLRTYSKAPLEWMIGENMPSFLAEGSEYLAANRRMEVSCGWSLAAFVLFMCAFVSCILKIRAKKGNCIEEKGLVAAGGAILLIYLLGCRYGNFMPWEVLRKIMPGADVIRVSGRCTGILVVPMAIVVCIWLCRMNEELKKEKDRARKARWRVMEIMVMMALLWSGQAEVHMNEQIGQARIMLRQVPEPPQDCRVMFMCPLDPDNYNCYMMNMEGWLIAEQYDLYTLNGYSGSFPAGWYLLADDIATYYEEIHNWIEFNQIMDTSGIYGYAKEAGMWVAYSDIVFQP